MENGKIKLKEKMEAGFVSYVLLSHGIGSAAIDASVIEMMDKKGDVINRRTFWEVLKKYLSETEFESLELALSPDDSSSKVEEAGDVVRSGEKLLSKWRKISFGDFLFAAVFGAISAIPVLLFLDRLIIAEVLKLNEGCFYGYLYIGIVSACIIIGAFFVKREKPKMTKTEEEKAKDEARGMRKIYISMALMTVLVFLMTYIKLGVLTGYGAFASIAVGVVFGGFIGVMIAMESTRD